MTLFNKIQIKKAWYWWTNDNHGLTFDEQEAKQEGESYSLATLEDLCSCEDILENEFEIFEGIVKWTERKVKLGKYAHDIETIYNYEFIDLNRENIDVDNPPEYLERFLYNQFCHEEMTIE